jgi:sugar porter (SP) family MFS transporter
MKDEFTPPTEQSPLISDRSLRRLVMFGRKGGAKYHQPTEQEQGQEGGDGERHPQNASTDEKPGSDDTDKSTASYTSSSRTANNSAPFPVTKATYLYAFCAALNSVNLGYDLGVSTNAGPLILDDFQLTTKQLELFLGSLNFWSIGGALLSPILSDRFGRRTTLRVAAVGFVLGVTVTALAPSYTVLMVGRMVVGLGVGIGEAIDPMYIAEIAPAHVRGELVSWAEAGVAIGVVLGFASSLLGVGWRIMLALGGILPLAMLYLATFVLPESPRWLVGKQQEGAARVVLQTIYPQPRVEDVIDDIHDSIALEQAASHVVGWGALLRPSPAIRRMLIVGVGIAIIQQAVGIDSVMFYLAFVLKNSGVTSDLGQTMSLIALGAVKLVFVFVGARLFDHLGRRPLLFTSLLGMAASLVAVAFTFTSTGTSMKVLTIVALATYLAFFSTGLGPGNWVVVSEVFATSIRAKAMMLAVLPNRITATLMASTFLSVANALSWPGFFLTLAGICLVSCIFLYIFLPETKGRTLEDMALTFAEITGDRSILDVEEQIRRERFEANEIELGEQHDNGNGSGKDEEEEDSDDEPNVTHAHFS